MPISVSAFRPILGIIIGLGVGIAGALLYVESVPAPEGSAEEKIAMLEVELKKATNRAIALEGQDPQGRRKPGRTFADGARSIADDLRDGRPVTPDDFFRATQPILRDFSPIFDRMRVKQQQRLVDSMSGEISRKYGLDAQQKEKLDRWMKQKAEDESTRYMAVLTQEGTTLEDIAKASMDFRLDDGLDQFMTGTLSGTKLSEFQTAHMLEKVERVQQEADMKIERLDGIVELDDSQRGQLFGLMARSARDFDPAMQFEGLGTDSTPLAAGGSREEALLQVLRPDQAQAYQAERQRRIDETKKEFEDIGLTLPDNWKSFDSLDF